MYVTRGEALNVKTSYMEAPWEWWETTRQGDQGTTKVGKRISRALSKVSATGFIQCGSGMLRQRLPEHATPNGWWMCKASFRNF